MKTYPVFAENGTTEMTLREMMKAKPHFRGQYDKRSTTFPTNPDRYGPGDLPAGKTVKFAGGFGSTDSGTVIGQVRRGVYRVATLQGVGVLLRDIHNTHIFGVSKRPAKNI